MSWGYVWMTLLLLSGCICLQANPASEWGTAIPCLTAIFALGIQGRCYTAMHSRTSLHHANRDFAAQVAVVLTFAPAEHASPDTCMQWRTLCLLLARSLPTHTIAWPFLYLLPSLIFVETRCSPWPASVFLPHETWWRASRAPF